MLQHGVKLENTKRCPELNCGGKRKVLLPGRCCQQCATGKLHGLREWCTACMANFNHNLCFVTDPIFVDWSDWSVWGGCSESCGGGVRLRQRFCNDSLATESTDVTIRCSGPTLELEDCNEHPCPSEHQHMHSCN